MRQLIKCLKALSDESRLRVLNLILERECCVCEVMQVMEISQSKASRILSALYDAGLLRLRKEGRWALYSVDEEGMNAHIKEILTEEQTKRLAEKYGVLYMRTELKDSALEYAIDHSSYFYFLKPDGTLVEKIQHTLNPALLVEAINRLVPDSSQEPKAAL